MDFRSSVIVQEWPLVAVGLPRQGWLPDVTEAETSGTQSGLSTAIEKCAGIGS